MASDYLRGDSRLQNSSFKSCNLKLSRLEVVLTFIVEYGVERVFPKKLFAVAIRCGIFFCKIHTLAASNMYKL